jgi:dienelactone hydrolase
MRVAFFGTMFLLAGWATTVDAQVIGQEEVEAEQQAQYAEIEAYLDRQVAAAETLRANAWQRDTSSVEAYERSIELWRAKLFEMLGGNAYSPAPLEPREELIAEFDTHRAFRVRIPTFAGVRAYGIVLVPRGEDAIRRPALICVHGMAGTPEGVCGLTAEPDYHNRFGLQAVQKGYVVFAPLNMNSAAKRNWLDRKAMMVGERLQALEQFKLLRVVDNLAARADVDPERIGAYGISWGGRTVMYLAALDRRVAACAISGHFNDLVPKMLMPSAHYTAYIETAENYAFFPRHALLFSDADVVSLICPRPVFIEQGREDRVAWWEMSERAFAPVQDIYRQLEIGERAEYSIFEGGHEVRGVEAFRFFDRWLRDETTP